MIEITELLIEDLIHSALRHGQRTSISLFAGPEGVEAILEYEPDELASLDFQPTSANVFCDKALHGFVCDVCYFKQQCVVV